MTYTKKRIIIDAEVPDGATHCAWCSNRFTWIRFKNNKIQYWFRSDSTWEYFINSRNEKINPIEEVTE